MSLQKLIEERKQLYKLKVSELRMEIDWPGIYEYADSPVHEFGYKAIEGVGGVPVIYTIPDWGNIGKFHSESINLILDGVVEMVEIKKKSRKWAEDKIQDGANKHKMFAKREGYNDALKDILSQLQTLKK